MFLNFLVLVFHEHATIGYSLIGSYKIRNDNYVVSYNQYKRAVFVYTATHRNASISQMIIL